MSEDRFIIERIYEGSSSYIASFGAGIALTVVGIISIILKITAVSFIGLRWWGFWMFIPAFFSFVGAIGLYTRYNRLRKEVLAALNSYQNNQLNLDDLANEVMMTRPSLMRLLIDLRADRYIKFRVDSRTGNLILGESFTPLAINTEKTSIKPLEMIFCTQCGQRIPTESIFCPNCGTSVQ